MTIDASIKQQFERDNHLTQPPGLTDQQREEWNKEAWAIIERFVKNEK